MRQVAGDLDIGDADRRQAMLAHGLVDQRAQLPAALGGNAITAIERLLCHDRLQRPLHFDALEAFDLVARLDVVVLLHADAAFGVDPDLVNVLLEAAQRFQLALEDHGVVAQHADRLVAPDHALHDHAAGHGAELGTAEYVADLGRADDLFTDLHAQDARRDLLHLVDHVVEIGRTHV